MHRLVDELLILVRFDAGQMVMARDPVELGPLLQGSIEKLTPQAQVAGVALELDASERLFVTGDGDRLAQVFTNLIDNALKHTSQGGRVTVAAREMASQPTRKGEKAVPGIEVSVADTGSGIPPEDLSRIFERFYHGKTSRGESGTGLGLAIAKALVEAQNGTIGVESQVGQGSVFTVTLPRVVVHGDAENTAMGS